MKIIAGLVILIALIFSTAITSLQIALSYTEEYVKEYGDNIFQNQIKFSSKTQSMMSYRLSREIYKIPFYISMLNSLHDKITEGKVILNNNNRPSIVNQMLLYQSQLTSELTKLVFKNKLFVNSWFQQNATRIDQLDTQGQEILYNLTRLIPFLNIIQYQSRQNISNVITIPYSQVSIFSSQQGIVLTNFANSSLSGKLDSNNCYKGLFDYDPRCRFFYLNSLNHTSIYMNSPNISLAAVPTYLSQYTCQMAKFYNKKTNKIENSHVQCIEATLSNIHDYFQNIIQSSKQYYVIDPRSLSIFFNSKKQQDYSHMTQADNFYNVELEYLQDQEQAKQILTFIQKNYSDWVFSKINNSSANLKQMFDLSQQIHVIDYKRNGTTYKAIFNPVIQYDQIPTVVTKYTQQQGLQLQYAYLQINIISDEDLKAQTQVLLKFFNTFFKGVQIGLAIVSFILLIITIFLAFKIQSSIDFPIIRMKETLEEINELKEFVEISEIIKKCEEKSQSIFLSKETTLLYQSFLDLFEMIQYTSESFFFENEGRTLISLSKKADFFKKFKNYRAAGVTHNNIGSILLNQQHFFQALEHFSLAIMYAKYEISAYQNSNPESQFSDLLYQYSYAEQINNKDKNQIKRHQEISIIILPKQEEQLHHEKKSINQNVQEFEKLAFNKRKISISPKILAHQFRQRNSRKISQRTKPRIFEEIQEQTISKTIQSTKKFLQMKKNNNLLNSKQTNFFFHQSEDKNQVSELILNLFYRQQNYIFTLIAFQESVDSVKREQKGLIGFNFWSEIKYLAKIQLNLINYFSELQYLKVFINCIISKCYYNQSKLSKAKLKFQETENFLKNLEQFYNEEKIFDAQSQNSTNQKYLITDSIKKSQFQSKQFNEIDQFQLDLNHNKSINNNLNIKQQQSHQRSSRINSSDLVSSTQLNFQFQQNQIPESQNSFDVSCRMLKKDSNYQNYKHQDKLNTLINIEKETKIITPFDKIQKTDQQKSERNISIPFEIQNQHFQFCKAEYFIFVKKQKKAAEILTNLLENSQNMSSRQHFRIIYKLKQIFEAHKIQDLKLYEEYSRFNRNISFHVVLSFELDLTQINYDKLNLSKQKSQENSIFISKQSKFCQQQINFFQDLSNYVLTKEKDKICLFVIDKEEQIVNKKMELIDFKLFKSLQKNYINDMNQSIMSQLLTKRIAEESNFYKQISKDSVYYEFKQLDNSEIFNDFQIQEVHLIDKYNQNIQKKECKNVFIKDLNQAQIIQSCNQERKGPNYLNNFYQQQKNYQETQQFQKNLQIFQKDRQIVNNFDQKMNVNEFLNDFDIQLNQYFKNIWPKKYKQQKEIANYYFYAQIRKSIDQLLSSQFTYKVSEDNFYKKKNQMNQNLEIYKQFFSEELNCLEQDKAFKFVIYQTQIFLVIQNSLFMKLCNILVKFNIQIILLLNQKGNSFLELSQNQTFTYQSKEVIKIFYSYEDIIQYLIFKRDKYSKYSYYSYIQYY